MGQSFIPDDDTADELVRGDVLLQPSTLPCSLSPFTFRIHSFFRTGVLLSHQNFYTLVPSVSTDKLVLPRCACCVLSRLRRDRHILLLNFYPWNRPS